MNPQLFKFLKWYTAVWLSPLLSFQGYEGRALAWHAESSGLDPKNLRTQSNREAGQASQCSSRLRPLKNVNKKVTPDHISIKIKHSQAWWHIPLIPALGRQRQVDFWVRGQPGLQSEFQDSHGYTDKPCFKKQDKQKTNKQKRRQVNKENLLTKNWAKLEHVVPAFSPVKGGGEGGIHYQTCPGSLGSANERHTHTHLSLICFSAKSGLF